MSECFIGTRKNWKDCMAGGQLVRMQGYYA